MRCVIMLASLVCLMSYSCGGNQEEDPCVKVKEECTGEGCIGDSWTWEKTGAFGDPCQSGTECISKLCAYDDALKKKYCTQSCDPEAEQPCPEEAECLASSNSTESVCGPPLPEC